jgi:MerR family transcriptional regulator, thiopeptide resistance regulator
VLKHRRSGNCLTFAAQLAPNDEANQTLKTEPSVKSLSAQPSEIERLIPVLVYEDIAAAHDFLVEAFGFTSGGIHRDADGKPIHAEVRAGDVGIWLHRVAAELKLASPRSMPAASSGVVVHVEDVDSHCERARARGAHLDSEPTDMPYGQREYGARDPEGHRWWFATPLS